jgi:hypothetical protein
LFPSRGRRERVAALTSFNLPRFQERLLKRRLVFPPVRQL